MCFCAARSVTPVAGAIVSKAIRFSIDGPVCTDPATCYPVGESDVTANIQLNNDASHVLPGAFLMVGFLEDFGQGIWDIPARSLSASSSTSERAYTPSYILMPPGTTSTYELTDWISRNSDLFDPEKGAVSPGIYRFETGRDIEGYPYCAIPGAEPVNGYEITTRGCVAPYAYQTSDAPALQNYLAPSSPEYANFPAQCKTSTGAVLLYGSRQSELTTPTINTAVNSPGVALLTSVNSFSVSFLYYKDAFTTDSGAVDAIEFASNSIILRFGVNSAGVPRAIISLASTPSVVAFDSSLTVLSNVDVRNGVWHHISFSVSGTSSMQINTFVDGTLLSQRTASNARPTSANNPFVRAISDITLNSAGAKVLDAAVYSSTNTQDAQNYRACAIANTGGGRCTNTTETVIIAKRNVTSTEGVTCASDSSLIYTEAGYNGIYPADASALANAFKNSWSTTFWTRPKRESVGTIVLQLRANTGSVDVKPLNNTFLQVFVNNVGFDADMLVDGRPHFVTATFNAATSQAQVYVDSVLLGTKSAPALAQVGTTTLNQNVQVTSMIKSYAYVLTSTQQNIEGLCQVSVAVGAFGFVAPVGYCAAVPGSNYGYCREQMMCQGHCGAYSAIDRATGTFTPLRNECDDGFALPDCTSRCSRIDPVTGQCLDKQGKTAVGLTPGGVLCPLASNFKLSAVSASKLLGAIPRFWQYTVSVGVPAGTITNVIETGSCPLTTITPNIDGSLLVNLQNSANVNSVVNILYAPDAVFSGEIACESPCCSLAVDNPVTIRANSVLSYAVPAANCGNVSVIIQQAVNVFDPFANTTIGSTQECSRFTGNDVAFIQSTAFNQAIPTGVQASIQVSQNLVAKGIKDTSDALGLQLINLLAIGAESNFASAEFKTSLALQAQAIREQTFNPINFTTSLPPYQISDAVSNLNNVTAAGNAALQKTISEFTSNENVRQKLEIVSRELEANITASLAEGNRQQALIVQAYRNSLIQNPDGGYDSSLESFLQDAGKVGAAVAIEAAHIGKTFIDTGLDLMGLPGSLLGGFGNLFGGFVKFLIYYMIVKLIGAAFSSVAPGASAAVGNAFTGAKDKFKEGFNASSSSKYSVLPTKDEPPIASRQVVQGAAPMGQPAAPGVMSKGTASLFRSSQHRNRMH